MRWTKITIEEDDGDWDITATKEFEYTTEKPTFEIQRFGSEEAFAVLETKKEALKFINTLMLEK